MPRLFGTLLTSGTQTSVYSAPTQSRATVTVNFCNQSSFPALIQLALSPSGTISPTTSDFIEYNTSLPAGASLERTGITPYNQESVFAYSSIMGVSVVVWGYAEGSL